MENNSIVDFYDKWSYPNFNNFNLEELLKLGARDISDPSINWNKFWPNRSKNDKLNILVAGCGTVQASIIAAQNKNCFVTGIDISEKSIEIQKNNAKNLSNIELLESSILEYNTDQMFDLIVCTGVLHHVEDPVNNINHMTNMLKDTGVMCIMLYNYTGRHGVYQIQKLVKMLKLENNLTGARQLAEIIDKLPEDHSVKKYIERTQEVDYLENFMDTFFNPYDRPYTIFDVKELVDQTNLEFYDWLNMDFDHNIKIDETDPFKNAYCADLIKDNIDKLSFILTKQKRSDKIK